MNPSSGSTVSLRIFSGWALATSSMSMPPSAEAMTVMRLRSRSRAMPR